MNSKIVSISESGEERIEASVKSEGSRDLVIIPRPSYEALILDVPPLKAEELETAIKYRLRAAYPGPADSTVFDHKQVDGEPAQRVVFASNSSILEKYGRQSEKTHFTSSTSIFLQVRRDGPWTGIYCADSWMEKLAFDGRKLLSSRLILKGGSDYAECVRAVLADDPNPAIIAYPRSTADQILPLSTVMLARPAETLVLSVDELLQKSSARDIELFDRNRNPMVFSWSLLVKCLIAVCLLLAASLPYRLAAYRELDLKEAKAAYEANKAESAASQSRLTEMESLETRLRELSAEQVARPYLLISDIVSSIGSDARIIDLNVQGSDFRFEAVSRDALKTIGLLTRSGKFESIELQQSIPDAGGGERFGVSGRLKHD
jgi:hypothetical protein